MQIKVSGGDWETISDTYNNYGGGWTYTSLDISQYSGSSVQIGFLLTSEGFWGESSGWYIDDVRLETGPIVFNNPEDWEGGLGDWYADRGTWQVGSPTSGPGSSHSGSNCAATVLDANYPGNAYTRLISPLIFVSDAGNNPFIGFWHWFNIEGHDSGYLMVRDASGTWQNILGPFSNSSGGWTYSYFDLSPYSNQTINVAFLLSSEGFWGESSGWYIDDIFINGLTIPVELISFTGAVLENKIQLSWQTATEINNQGFDIERSSDSKTFTAIGTVEGNGTTTELHEYSFSDKPTQPGKYYYRLKQIDFDGSFEYSQIVEVDFNNVPDKYALLQNYPNPFNPSTKISWQSPIGSWQTLKVYDVLGNEVATLVDEYKPAGNYEVEFQSSVGNHQLASGVYYYQLRTGDPSTGSGQSFVETRKMIILK